MGWRVVAASLALLVQGACSRCEKEQTFITEISADCDAGSWTYQASTEGWTTDGAVNIAQTGASPSEAWSEEHDLPSVQFGGCWDEIEVRLPIITSWEDQEHNVNTLFECTAERRAELTWLVRVWDTDNIMVDCAVWGEDPAYFDDHGGEELACREWDV